MNLIIENFGNVVVFFFPMGLPTYTRVENIQLYVAPSIFSPKDMHTLFSPWSPIPPVFCKHSARHFV